MFCAVFLGLAQTASAQVQDLSIDRSPTSAGPTLHVNNFKSKDIDALLLTVRCSEGPFEIFYDPLIDYGTLQAIAPGKGVDIKMSAHTENCPASANAVLLSDGSQEGDPSSAYKIFARRHGAYKQLTLVEHHLALVFSNKENISEVIGAIEIARTSLVSQKQTTVAELSGSSALLGFLEYLLKQRQLPHVPRYPNQPIPSVSELALSRALTQDQAYILCFDLRLQQWIADLRSRGAATLPNTATSPSTSM